MKSSGSGDTTGNVQDATRERVEIKGTIRRAIEICYGSHRKFLGMSAVVSLPAFALMLLNMARDPKNTMSPAQGFVGLFSLALLVATFVLMIYYLGALPLLTAFVLDDRPLDWTDGFAWIRERELFWGVFLAYLLTGLAALGGLVLLIVPGFIFGAWFMLAGPARVLGDHRGRAALSESRRLVRPVFRGALGLGLLLLLPVVVLTGVAQGVCAAQFGLFSSSPGRIIVPAVVTYLVGVFWGPVAGVGLSLFYIERAGGLPALRKDLFL